MPEWLRWSSTFQMCVSAPPGSMCQHQSGGSTIYVGLSVEPALYEGPTWNSLVVAGVDPVSELIWDVQNSRFNVEHVGEPWYSDGLRAGDSITHLDCSPITEDADLTQGADISILRVNTAFDITLSPLPK